MGWQRDRDEYYNGKNQDKPKENDPKTNGANAGLRKTIGKGLKSSGPANAGIGGTDIASASAPSDPKNTGSTNEPDSNKTVGKYIPKNPEHERPKTPISTAVENSLASKKPENQRTENQKTNISKQDPGLAAIFKQAAGLGKALNDAGCCAVNYAASSVYNAPSTVLNALKEVANYKKGR